MVFDVESPCPFPSLLVRLPDPFLEYATATDFWTPTCSAINLSPFGHLNFSLAVINPGFALSELRGGGIAFRQRAD